MTGFRVPSRGQKQKTLSKEGRLATIDPDTGLLYKDSFLWQNASGIKDPWTSDVSGAGAAINSDNSLQDANHYGIVSSETGTTATGRANFFLAKDVWKTANGTTRIESDIRIEDLSTVAEEYIYRWGLFDGDGSADMANGVYFEYDRLTNVNWRIKTAAASTRSTTNTSTAVAADAWINLRIDINAAGTSCEYFINGTSVGTQTTNIPTLAIGPGQHITKSAGSTTRKVYIDDIYWDVVYTTPR